jgi:signal transduction histidine kinase
MPSAILLSMIGTQSSPQQETNRRPFRVHARLLSELGDELISSDGVAIYELIKNAYDANSPWARVEVRAPVSPSELAPAMEAFAAEPSVESLKASGLAPLLELETVRREVDRAMAAPATSEGDSTLVRIEGILRRAIVDRSLIVIEDRGSGMDRSVLEDAFLSIATPMRLLERATESKRAVLGSKGIGRLAAMRLGRYLRVETAPPGSTDLHILDIDWSAFNVDSTALLDDVLTDMRSVPNVSKFSGTRLVISALNELWTLNKLQVESATSVSQLMNPFSRNEFKIHLFFNGAKVDVGELQKQVLKLARFHASGKVDARRDPPLEMRLWHFDEPHSLPLPERGFDWESELGDVGPFAFEIWEFDRNDRERGGKNATVIGVFCDRWGGGGPMLFRDGFRVLPYGSKGNDWLEVDRTSYRSGRGVRLRTPGVVGYVSITAAANPGLVDMSNREGLRMTPAGRAFVSAMQNVAQIVNQQMQQLEPSRRSQPLARVARMRRSLEAAVAAAASQASELAAAIPSTAPHHEQVEQLALTVASVTERARAYLAVNDRRGGEGQGIFQALLELAGLGLTAETVSHELLALIERGVGALADLAKASPELRVRAGQLRANLQSIRSLVLYLSPLTQTERREVGDINVAASLREAAKLYPSLGTSVQIDIQERSPLFAEMSEGALLQVFDNLVNNSVYWMTRGRRSDRRIEVVVDGAQAALTLRDTGPGIDPEVGDAVFEPFVSGKPKGRGLGLYVASELLTLEGGQLSLGLPDGDNRIREFRLSLPRAGSAKEPA